MRGAIQQDPYLYEDVPVLCNLANIKDAEALREIHRIIFGDLFE